MSSFVCSFEQNVFFNGAICRQLVRCIDCENTGIRLAMYAMTDPVVQDALIRAHRRGVHVECVFDQYTQTLKSGKGFALSHAGIRVFQYVPCHPHGLMHRKTFDFENNSASLKSLTAYVQARSLIATGSCNATKNAYGRSEEDMIISEDLCFIRKYRENFENMKQNSLEVSSLLAARRIHEK